MQKMLIVIAVCLAMICSITVAMKPTQPQVVYKYRTITLPELPVASCEEVELVIPEMPEEIPQPKDREYPSEVPQPNCPGCCPAVPNYHYYYHGGCRWEYTPGQPIRNIGRFFHNRQPVRSFFRNRQPVRRFFRGIGRIFFRRCC